MTVINRSALLPYQASQLFDLVNDVEAYPQYMDGCVGARVLNRELTQLEAQLNLAKGGIEQSFITRNTLVPSESITLELVNGPFDKLAGIWTFIELGDAACKISLHLEFSMSNGLLGAAAGKQSIFPLSVSVGTSALEAARQSGVDKQYEGIDLDNAKLGIFGKAVAPSHVLSGGDRVEVYRPLIADPKEVRKARAAKAKERRAKDKEA